jgi:hypothetical protein
MLFGSSWQRFGLFPTRRTHQTWTTDLLASARLQRRVYEPRATEMIREKGSLRQSGEGDLSACSHQSRKRFDILRLIYSYHLIPNSSAPFTSSP